MKIAVDLDGVVFNSEMFFMAAAEIYDAKILGKNSILKSDEPRVQQKYCWSEEELSGYISRYANSDAFDVMPCAKEVIDTMRLDNELYVISARGQFNPMEIEIAKKKLAEAGITFDKYFFGYLNKKQIVKENNIDIIIDDRYDVCRTLSKEKVFCLYFRMAGRKVLEQTDYLKEVNNWGEVYRILLGRGVIASNIK